MALPFLDFLELERKSIDGIQLGLSIGFTVVQLIIMVPIYMHLSKNGTSK